MFQFFTLVNPCRPYLVNRMRVFLHLVTFLSACSCVAAQPVANGSASKPDVSKPKIKSTTSAGETKSDVKTRDSVQILDLNENHGPVPSATPESSAKEPIDKPMSTATESIKADTVVNETSTASPTSSGTNSSQETLSNSSLPSTSPPTSCSHLASTQPPSGGFHGWSFVGGILLVSALICTAFVGFKCYKMKSSYNRF